MIKSICFLTTNQCNAQCDYCECRPHDKTRIAGDDLLKIIDEAFKLGSVGQVVFSGGESTLLGKDLFRGIEHAASKGMLTRVVTNGWWGKKGVQAALDYLDRLIEAGLTELNLSVDDWHQDWIPLDSVKHVFHACQERRFPCLIAHKAAKNAGLTKVVLERVFNVDLIDFEEGKDYDEDESTRMFSTGVMIPVGPTKTVISTDDLIYSSWQQNCTSVLKDIIVGANYQLKPCCGIVSKNIPEFNLGDIRTARMIDILDKANTDLLLNWIALEGPAAIAEFVTQKDPSVTFDKKYTGICHICNEVLTRDDVREVLRTHLAEKKPEIQLQRKFLETVRADADHVRIYC